MSSERDLPPTDSPLRQYAILSVPRSGSTLLARALEQTGQLGVPHEYLNPNAMAAWRHFGGDPSTSVMDYLKEIQSRRTSPSGWFAIKTHYRQFRQHFGGDAFSCAVDFVNSLDMCILITRKDHIAQAVSYYRARYTGMWTSEHESLVVDARPSSVPFDAKQLMDCLDEIETGEKKWREVVASSSTPCLEVTYEELSGRYVDEIARTLTFLGVEAEVPLPMPTRRTAAGIEDNLVEEFRWYLSERE